MWPTRVMHLWSWVAVTLTKLLQVVLVEHSTLTLKWRVYGQGWNHFISGNACIFLMWFIFTCLLFFKILLIFEVTFPALLENIVISGHHPNITDKCHCSKRVQMLSAPLYLILTHCFVCETIFSVMFLWCNIC